MSELKKRGRPSLGDAARRNTVSTMVSDDERVALHCAAKARGLTLAEYLRWSALEPFILRPLEPLRLARGPGDVGSASGTTRRAS
jgi:hypothetical protein